MTNQPRSGMGSGFSKQNPGFRYPDNNIRFLDAQRSLDEFSGVPTFGNVTKRRFAVQRGYMRNLQPATLTNITINKCYFQFNPQEIRQNVQMREDIYNPILLTAEQLSQPIGGNVSFQFDLFFDRSHELSANQKGPISPYTNENLESNDPTNKGPDQIGVYADLKVLYNIIGQGLSDQTIELQLEMLRNTYNAKVKRESAYSSSSETTGTSDTTTEATTVEDTGNPYDRDFTDKEALAKLFESNVGNAAFLLPNPVRIVFSPLLMVDGFVTSTSVDFLKFNNDMIPMQCRVAMGVNALYIGFAKPNTFLTTTISTGREALLEEQIADKTAINPIDNIMTSNPAMSPFRLGFGTVVSTQASAVQTDWDTALQNGSVPGNNLVYYLMPDDVVQRLPVDSNLSRPIRVGFVGFPGIKPKKGAGKDLDPILTAFEDPNSNFSISYSWDFKIYGNPTQNNSNGVGWTASQASAVANAGTFNKSETAALVGSYSYAESATSKEEWGAGGSGGGVERIRIRRRSYHGTGELPNKGSYTLDFSTGTRKTNIQNSYYVLVYSLTILISSGSQTRTYTASDKDLRRYVCVAKGDGLTGVNAKLTSSTTSIYFSKSE